jgi:hypothetical protein
MTVTVNQYLTENLYRRFPFVQTATLPFSDAVVIDAQIVIGSNQYQAGNVVTLVSLVRSSGQTIFHFLVTPIGLAITCTVPDSTVEQTRILASFSSPQDGYGFLVIGSTASLITLSPGTITMSAALDPTVVRLAGAVGAFNVTVANMPRSVKATEQETHGTPRNISTVTRESVQTLACVEYPNIPVTTQASVDPTTYAVTMIAIPQPVDYVVTAMDTGTIVTTVTPNTPTDFVPTPAAYATTNGSVSVGFGFLGGYNLVLSGNQTAGTLVFGYQYAPSVPQTLCGLPALSPAPYPSGELGTLSIDCVKSVNGVYTTDGALTLTAGSNVSIISDPGGHRLLLVVNPQNLDLLAPYV